MADYPCPEGQRWDDASQTCVTVTSSKCPEGQHWDGRKCVWDEGGYPCPEGQRWDNEAQTCVPVTSAKCPAGQRWDGRKCVLIDVTEDGNGDGDGDGDGDKPPWDVPYTPDKDVGFPTLTLPRYEEYGVDFPISELPVYEPFAEPYPTLKLPAYEGFPTEYPELPAMYGEAGDVISRMLKGEGFGLPIEELMAAYTEEERLAMEEYMPELREYWAGKNLLRSGMERAAEEEVTREAAAARGTYRANLVKESVIRQQEGVVTGLNLAMQHVGIGYGAQSDAWNAAMSEYTKVYSSKIQTGMAHFEASTEAWDAAMNEYTKAFSSQVASTEFGQRIQEMAFGVARDEYQRVYQSELQGGLSEWEADARGWDAAWTEFSTLRNLLFGWATMEAGFTQQVKLLGLQQDFQKMMFDLEADLTRELALLGYTAEQSKSIWSILTSIIIAAIPFLL